MAVFTPGTTDSAQALAPIDLGHLLRVLFRYKWAILTLGFMAAGIAAAVVFTMAPVYRASASIELESEDVNVVAVEEVYGFGRAGFEYFQTQFEILKSRSLAEQVVMQLSLQDNPLFAPEPEEPSFSLSKLLPAAQQTPPQQLSETQREQRKVDWATAAVVAGLRVDPVEFSHIAYISFDSSDPVVAAQIANAVVERFIAGNLDQRLSGTLQATDWLNTRLSDLKYNLRISEEALQAFREEKGLVNVDGVTSPGGNELKILSARLAEATRTRIAAQNIRREVQELEARSTEELMGVPAVLSHPLIHSLNTEQSRLERKAVELAKRYGPLHPRRIAADSDLQAGNDKLAREVQNVVSGINREYEVALRNEQHLKEGWDARKSQVQEFNRIEFQLAELQREVDTNRALYDIFFTRIKNISETGGFATPHARVIDRALVPSSPIRPSKRLAVLAAFALGLFLGGVLALLLDLLDNTVKSPDDVLEKLDTPLLGTLPELTTKGLSPVEQFRADPQSPFAEAIRTIRTGVILSSLDEPAKIIVVTSSVPGEGKSTLVMNLGAALAQMERTLIIGADLRRPALAHLCDFPDNHPGLSHFVSGTAELEECISELQGTGLQVMPAGMVPANPLEMVSSRRFVEALEVLKQRFDRIVIDSAPLLAVSDALVLGACADSVIYVVKADETPTTEVAKGLAALRDSHATVTGVVLNQVNASVGKYGPGQYYPLAHHSDAAA